MFDCTTSDPKVEGHDCGIIIIMGKGKRSNSCVISQFWSTLNHYHFSDIQTGREVWNHLKGMYLESNFAKQYEPKMSIHHHTMPPSEIFFLISTTQKDKSITTQQDKSIQEFYSEMTT